MRDSWPFMILIQLQSGLGTAQGSGTVRQSVLVFSILLLVQTAPNRGWSDIAIYNFTRFLVCTGPHRMSWLFRLALS
jgi:hypothetical protein